MYLCLIFIFCDIDVSVQAGYFIECPSSRATASTRFSPVRHFCEEYYVGDLLAFSVPHIGKHDDGFVLLLGMLILMAWLWQWLEDFSIVKELVPFERKSPVC